MSDLEQYMLPCLNKKLFGVDCMGCGMQRSFSLLIHGEFIEAFKMYPAIYTLALMFLVVGINAFKPIKYGYKTILFLALLNAVIIITSFIFKTFLIK